MTRDRRGAPIRTLKNWLAPFKYRLTAPRPSPHPEGASPGAPIVAGFLGTPSGIGESARLCLESLRRLGCEPRAVDLSPQFLPHDLLAGHGEPDPASARPGPLIIHANPPELPAVCAHLGPATVHGRLVVGYWAWELSVMPSDWVRGFAYVHEIWVPSTFTAQAVAPHTGKPVRVVHHRLPEPTVTGRRQNFGLPDNAFVALTVCDLRSSLARKNPLGAMEAFTMAFGTGGRQILLVKVGGIRGNETTFRFLEQKVASAPNVRLLTETLSPAGMEALISCVDVLVSLHRAEGFGLVPAQAMRAGKPVVATEWSGPKDFLTADNAALVPANLVPVDDPQGLYGDPGSVWAEPDLATAANHLRRLAESPDTARILGERAREDMRRFCSLERYWSTLGAPFRAASRARP